MCPRHSEADLLITGLCIQCGIVLDENTPEKCLIAVRDFVFKNAAWLVIAAAAVMLLANLWWWYQLDFRIVG